MYSNLKHAYQMLIKSQVPWVYLILLLSASNSFAQKFPYEANQVHPVKLVDPVAKVCASGFLIEDKIISNYHVSSSICPSGICDNLKVYPANQNDYLKTIDPIVKQKAAPAYDLAILKIKLDSGLDLNMLPSVATLSTGTTKETGANKKLVTAYSFPSCADLQISEAEEFSNLSNLYLKTSLALRHGSSGAIVVNHSNQPVGIVSESDSLIDGAKSLLIKSNFDVTRIVPIDRLTELLNNDPESLFNQQIETLLNFYIQNVAKESGLKRIEEGSRFLEKVKALGLENISDNKNSEVLLLAISNYPYPLFTKKGWALDTVGEKTALLAVAASLENSGLKSAFATKLSPEQVNQILNGLSLIYPSLKSKLSEIFEIVGGYPGLTYYSLQKFIPIIAKLLLLLIIYCLVAIYLLSRKKSSFVSRVFRIAILTLFTLIALSLTI